MTMARLDQLFKSFQQLQHLNQRAGMVLVIFCAHLMATHYTNHLHQDPHISHVAFSAMTIKHSWTTMQKWVVNNWESYLIVCCGGVNDLTFNGNQEDLLPYMAFTVPPC